MNFFKPLNKKGEIWPFLKVENDFAKYLHVYIEKLKMVIGDKELNSERHRFYETLLTETGTGTPEFEIQKDELQNKHKQFTEKVFHYLLNFWGIPDTSKHNTIANCQYFEYFMGNAILSLCMLYRDRWRETFKEMHGELMQSDYFVFYCCTTLPEKGCRYFYYYLQRIAIIFEITLYCYEYGHNYIEVAQNVASFVDLVGFIEAGDWPELKRIAAVIDAVTRPLQFAVVYPKYEFKDFTDLVREEDFELKNISTPGQFLPQEPKHKLEKFPNVIKKLEELKLEDIEDIRTRNKLLEERKYKLKCFRDVIEKLEEFASTGKINITTRGLSLLKELDEKIIHLESKRKEILEKQQPGGLRHLKENVYEARAEQSIWDTLVTFFNQFLPGLCEKTSGKKIHSDFIIGLDFWKENDSLYKTILQCFRELQRYDRRTNDKKQKECFKDHLKEYFHKIELKIESKSWKSGNETRRYKRKPQKIHSSSINANTSYEGIAPSKQCTRYIPIETDHVEQIVKLFAEAMPLFLDDYLNHYVVSNPKCSFSGSKEFYLVLDGQYYWSRIMRVIEPHPSKRMQGFKYPYENIITIVPLEVQRALDFYILHDNFIVFVLDSQHRTALNVTENLVIAGASDHQLSFEQNRPVWFLIDALEVGFPFGSMAIEILQKLLKNTKQFQGSDAQLYDAADLMFSCYKNFEIKKKK